MTPKPLYLVERSPRVRPISCNWEKMKFIETLMLALLISLCPKTVSMSTGGAGPKFLSELPLVAIVGCEQVLSACNCHEYLSASLPMIRTNLFSNILRHVAIAATAYNNTCASLMTTDTSASQ